MNSNLRKQLLFNGWKEPIDESLVSPPSGWYHGEVIERGVGHWVRQWVNVDDPLDEQSNVTEYLAVEYGEGFDEVRVSKYAEGRDGGYYHVEDIDTKSMPEEAEDQECAEQAVKLMEGHS